MKKMIGICVLFLAASVLAYPAQLSFKLTGGINWMSGSDYNDGVKGVHDYYVANYPPVTGTFQSLGNALKFQGEAILMFTPDIGVGIGGGYTQIKKSDTVTYTLIGYPDAITYSPNFSVVPLFLNFHYFVPAGSMLDIDLYAGPALYLTSLKWTDSDVYALWNTHNAFSSKGTAFGFQAGAGLDIKLGSSLAVVLDASYHFGKVSEVKGTRTSTGTVLIWPFNNSYPNTYLWSSTLGGYPVISLNDVQPDGGRKAALDLSGIALMAGIKIGL
jgi:opacity protein-like surface antigen